MALAKLVPSFSIGQQRPQYLLYSSGTRRQFFPNSRCPDAQVFMVAMNHHFNTEGVAIDIPVAMSGVAAGKRLQH